MKKNIIISLVLLVLLSAAVMLKIRADTADFDVTAKVIDTTVVINGYTLANAFVVITENGSAIATTQSNNTGFYEKTITPIDDGVHTFQVYSTDVEGNNTLARQVDANLAIMGVTTYSDVNLPPTLYITHANMTMQETIDLHGYSRPNATILLTVTGPVSRTYVAYANSEGYYGKIIIPADLVLGLYNMTAHVDPGYESGAITFSINPPPTATPYISPTPGPTGLPKTPTPGGPVTNNTPEPTETPVYRASNSGGNTKTVPALQTNVKPCPHILNPVVFPQLPSVDRNATGVVQVDSLSTFVTNFNSEYTSNNSSLDLNGDCIVDERDFSIYMSNTVVPENTLYKIEEAPKNLDGDPETLTRIMGNIQLNTREAQRTLVAAALIVGSFMIFMSVMLMRVMFTTTIPRRRATILLYLLSMLLVGYFTYTSYLAQSVAFLYNNRNLIAENIFTKRSSKPTTTAQYSVLVGSTERTINVVRLEVVFDPNVMQLERIDTVGSFANVFTHKEFSNTKGYAFVLGGLPHPGYKGSPKKFVTFVFKKTGSLKKSITVLPRTSVYADDNKGTNIIHSPNVRIQVKDD